MTTPLWKRIIARILEALLAIIFISPLVWVITCSVIRKVCPSTCSTR